MACKGTIRSGFGTLNETAGNQTLYPNPPMHKGDDPSRAYTKGLDKPIGVACARACAKNGSTLVILRDDGTIFLPIDSKTPSSSQNPRLMPFAGEHVTVTGKEYVRKASHALVIEKISR